MKSLLLVLILALYGFLSLPTIVKADTGITYVGRIAQTRAVSKAAKKKCRKRIKRKASKKGWSKKQQRKKIRRCIQKQEEKEGGSDDESLAFIQGIAEARNLFIAQSSTSTSDLSVNNVTNSLFAVREDGFILEVSYVGEQGGEVQEFRDQLEPFKVMNAGSNYTIVVFKDYRTSEDGFVSYLVRKSDSAVFKFDDQIDPAIVSYDDISCPIQTDGSDNIYFVEEKNKRIVKVDVSDPANIIASDYIPETETAFFFLVDEPI